MRALVTMILLSQYVSACKAGDGPLNQWRMVDLSHELANDVPVYPGGTGFSINRRIGLESGFYLNDFTMSEHCGTHIDAPSHKSKEGRNVEKVLLRDLYGPLIVIDVRQQSSGNPDYSVTLDDVLLFEQQHGSIPEGGFVFAYTGWCDKWKSPAEYVNLGEDGTPHFPGFGPQVTQFLLASRKIKGMGIDTLSTDPGISKEFLQHRIFLEGGGINVENAANLGSVPPTGAFILISPLKIHGGSGGPARITAFVQREGGE